MKKVESGIIYYTEEEISQFSDEVTPDPEVHGKILPRIHPVPAGELLTPQERKIIDDFVNDK